MKFKFSSFFGGKFSSSSIQFEFSSKYILHSREGRAPASSSPARVQFEFITFSAERGGVRVQFEFNSQPNFVFGGGGK